MFILPTEADRKVSHIQFLPKRQSLILYFFHPPPPQPTFAEFFYKYPLLVSRTVYFNSPFMS